MRKDTLNRKQTAEEALESCIVKIREGVKKEPCHSNISIDPAAEDYVRNGSLKKFQQHLDTWNESEPLRGKVRKTASAIGQIAHILADVAGTQKIDASMMQHAVQAAKPHCTAGLPPSIDMERWIFCPD